MIPGNPRSEHVELGVIVGLGAEVEGAFRKVADLGLTTCQLSCWRPDTLDAQLAQETRRVGRRVGIKVSSFWAGYGPPVVWNFLEGPATIGLVPPKYRAKRIRELIRGAEFAARIGAPSITTHVGFIPEDPHDPRYPGTVEAVRTVAQRCRSLGLDFQFETGQETPVTLLRTIQDVGTDNLAINLDPANLILYGKANPVDAMEVFGCYVRGMHAKDGVYPTDGRSLGKEVALGKGKVDFPALLHRLVKLGFKGPITIEREISGPQQVRDIRRAVKLLRHWL
jgi:sugar phosphate isomerase/epimerase